MSTYLSVAALGDSTTVGIGDPVPGGWRGWSRLLVDALAPAYDVSYCNTAVSGCTTSQMREHQFADAVAHRPDVATMLVEVNDTLRATWDAERTRRDLLACADVVALPSETLYAKMDYPLVLLEAMLLERPVVVCAGTPAAELQSAGARAVDADVDALRAELRSLLDDADERARMGARSRAAVLERFSPSAVAAEYEAVYRSILG